MKRWRDCEHGWVEGLAAPSAFKASMLRRINDIEFRTSIYPSPSLWPANKTVRAKERELITFGAIKWRIINNLQFGCPFHSDNHNRLRSKGPRPWAEAYGSGGRPTNGQEIFFGRNKATDLVENKEMTRRNSENKATVCTRSIGA